LCCILALAVACEALPSGIVGGAIQILAVIVMVIIQDQYSAFVSRN